MVAYYTEYVLYSGIAQDEKIVWLNSVLHVQETSGAVPVLVLVVVVVAVVVVVVVVVVMMVLMLVALVIVVKIIAVRQLR